MGRIHLQNEHAQNFRSHPKPILITLLYIQREPLHEPTLSPTLKFLLAVFGGLGLVGGRLHTMAVRLSGGGGIQTAARLGFVLVVRCSNHASTCMAASTAMPVARDTRCDTRCATCRHSHGIAEGGGRWGIARYANPDCPICQNASTPPPLTMAIATTLVVVGSNGLTRGSIHRTSLPDLVQGHIASLGWVSGRDRGAVGQNKGIDNNSSSRYHECIGPVHGLAHTTTRIRR